jgi:hypothetical protein
MRHKLRRLLSQTALLTFDLETGTEPGLQTRCCDSNLLTRRKLQDARAIVVFSNPGFVSRVEPTLDADLGTGDLIDHSWSPCFSRISILVSCCPSER